MRIFITGITGFLGRELARHLRDQATLGGLSRDEHKIQKLTHNIPAWMFLGDVTHPDDVSRAVLEFDPDFIVHAAALKIVPLSEQYPEGYIRTNVLGSMHVARVADKLGCSAVLVSSDKAVSPHNLYGVTKRAAEKIFLNYKKSVVRYGNVFGATGSVYPLWKSLTRRGEPLAVTDTTMTRFYISRQKAVEFVMECGQTPGLWVPKLSAYGMGDFLTAFQNVHGQQKIEKIPVRPGEKYHEVLVSQDELPDARDWGEEILISPFVEGNMAEPYSSNRVPRLSVEQLEEIMREFDG